jgi:hypothetical protein
MPVRDRQLWDDGQQPRGSYIRRPQESEEETRAHRAESRSIDSIVLYFGVGTGTNEGAPWGIQRTTKEEDEEEDEEEVCSRRGARVSESACDFAFRQVRLVKSRFFEESTLYFTPAAAATALQACHSLAAIAATSASLCFLSGLIALAIPEVLSVGRSIG